MSTPGPYGARETGTDLAIGPSTVPAGATVFYSFWAGEGIEMRVSPRHADRRHG